MRSVSFCRCNFKLQTEAVSVLQVRGCKVELQKGCLSALEILIPNMCPKDMVLELLPNTPACSFYEFFCSKHIKHEFSFKYSGRLKTLGHDMDLASWEVFLKYVGWHDRPCLILIDFVC